MKSLTYLFLILIIVGTTFAQNTTIQPDRVTIPKMTTAAKNSLPNKVEGMMVYDSDLKQFSYWTGAAWANFGSTPASGTGWQLSVNPNDINTTNSGNVGIGVTSPSKAKVEVSKNSFNGTTNGLFGSGQGGISLQQNYPTIGYNQYRDAADNNNTKFMSDGWAAVNFLDPNGDLAWYNYGNGYVNTITTTNTPLLRLKSNGDIQAYGKVTTAATGTSTDLLPIAFGKVNSDGSLAFGTSNVTTAYHDAGINFYSINLGNSISVTNCVMVVTPIFRIGYIAYFADTYNSHVFDVQFLSPSGDATGEQTDFSFVVYKAN